MRKRLEGFVFGVALFIASLALGFGAKQAYATTSLTMEAPPCPNNAAQGIAGPCTPPGTLCWKACKALGLPPSGSCIFLPEYGQSCCVCNG